MSVDTQQSNYSLYMGQETIQETEPEAQEEVNFPALSQEQSYIVSITIGKQKIR